MLRSTWMVLKRRTRTRSSRQEGQRRGRQGPQRRRSSAKRACAGEVALPDELLQEPCVGGAVGEVPAAAHPQRLVDGLLEAVVGLLDVAVLVRDPGVVGRRLHPVVGQQRAVALRWPACRPSRIERRIAALRWSVRCCCGTPPSCQRHALEPFGQRLEALREADWTASTFE